MQSRGGEKDCIHIVTIYRNRLRNSCRHRSSGGFSNCSQKLRWPIDVFAEVRNRGLSGKMFRQKKHKANSSSAPSDMWSGMFTSDLL